MKHQVRWLCGATLLAFFAVEPVLAQDAEAEASNSEIIVTARKIAESVQDIPVSITAFTAEDISNKSITELEDVALLTPGLTFEDYSNGGYGSPTIRGATQFSLTGLEQNVSTFLDGVYIPRQYAVDIGSMNLDRIEVVKGPQSALYGANSFAGAINYVTTSRSLSETTGRVEGSYSENKGFDLTGKANIVVIPDVMSMRFSAGVSGFAGDWKNNHPDAGAQLDPGTNESIGGYRKWSLQVGMTAKPFDKLTLDFDYYHFNTQSETKAVFRLTRANRDLNCSQGTVFGVPTNLLYCGQLPSTPIPGSSGRTGLVIDPRTYGLDAETRLSRVGATFDVTDELSLTYQFGHITGKVFSAGSSDRDALVGNAGASNTFSLLPSGSFNYDSHEGRLQYDGANGIYVMAGVFSQRGYDLDQTAFYLAPFRSLTPIPRLPVGAIVSNTRIWTNTDAVFGRIEVPLISDRLKISAEARYTDENKRLTAPVGTFRYKDKYFTPRFGIDFHASPDNLIYASVAKGVKSGGVNTSTFARLIAAERFYGPDENWTYEIGTKNSFGRGTLNAALFLIDWSNLQVPSTPTGAPVNTASITANLGGAKSKGIEIEGTYELIDGFTVNAGLAYIDATYNDGLISARITRSGLCNGGVCPSNGDVGGNDLQRNSKVQWNVGAAYEAPISSSLDFFGRVDVAGQSKQYVDETNTSWIEPRTLVNARLGVKGESWSASLWAKNLFDKKYVANAFYVANPFQVDYVPALGNRRRVGVTLSYDF